MSLQHQHQTDAGRERGRGRGNGGERYGDRVRARVALAGHVARLEMSNAKTMGGER